MLILTCQSRTTRAADAFKHLWFNWGKTKAVKREIRCWRLRTKPPADPAVGVGLTFWMMPPGEKCNMKKSLCPGKQMTPEATLRLPASGYTWRQGVITAVSLSSRDKRSPTTSHSLVSSHLIFAQRQQSVVFSEFCALIFCQRDVAALVGWVFFGGWDFCFTSSSAWF